MLHQLKREGIRQSDLVTIYVCLVRPELKYACPVRHTDLQNDVSDNIEMIQKRAIKCIFPGRYIQCFGYTSFDSKLGLYV